MQTFGPFVELFSIHGIDMLGNMDSGAVVGFTSEAAEVSRLVLEGRADADEITQIDERLSEFLVRNGFFEQEPKHAHPKSAYVHVTQRCNLNCVGCYSMSELRNCSEDPSQEQLGHAFGELGRSGVRTVNISGGEPFLREDLCDIARIANEECGIASVNIVTNGTVLGDIDLTDLAKWVASVTVSIDGPSATAPAFVRREQRFDKLMHTVSQLKDAGITTRILPTLHAKNIEDVPAYFELARKTDCGMNFSLLSCPPEIGEMADLTPTDADLQRLVELRSKDVGFGEFSGPFGIAMKAKRTCGAGCKNLSVDVDGWLYPCHMLQSKDYRMGNLFTERLDDVLSRSRDNVAQWLLPVERIETCKLCEYRLICGGGCRARAVNSGAGPAGDDPYCSLSNGFYRSMFSALSESVSKA